MKKKTRSIGPEMMPQISVRMIPFNSPEEHQQMLRDLATSSEFDMRHRGLFEYYGKDFITYKRLKPFDQARNEFLRIIAKFMSECLEDNCPSSWKQCQPSFWEELIFTFYPHTMNISPNNNETENFIGQLLKFVRWLDKQAGTSWYPAVEEYALIAFPELQKCEKLLNSLFLRDYPRIHHEDYNPSQDFEKVNQQFNQCPIKLGGIYEVTSVLDDSVILMDLKTKQSYSIKGLPDDLIVPGMIMDGTIGKQKSDLFWYWYVTIGIFPQRAKNFIMNIPKNGPILKCLGILND
ncbi:hypothetical protein [Bacillus sp. EB600]|uniref:hypothetical protein n=1 Tax=Bacillus sp. EB600 TaxID=2806345 RepID=UPI002109BE4B|nr:hypothetical protein [Bacillus sp. EB600]MCQ6280879.1 hypothetical protein [Bacillus sp. EB600]